MLISIEHKPLFNQNKCFINYNVFTVFYTIFDSEVDTLVSHLYQPDGSSNLS